MKLLITGGNGQLGREFSLLSDDNISVISCDRNELDITDINSIRAAVQQYKPAVIINTAAYTAVDKAESETALAFAINAIGVENIAIVAEENHIPLLHVSTDYVFSGEKAWTEKYTEHDVCAPQSVYGHSKHEGEKRAMANCTKTFILRTSWVFGRFGNNFPKTMLKLATERDELRVVNDQIGCPTYATDIANALIIAAQKMYAGTINSGIYHFCGNESCTWYEFADFIFKESIKHKHKRPRLIPIPSLEYPTPAKRPANSILDCSKTQKTLHVELSDWKRGIELLFEN